MAKYAEMEANVTLSAVVTTPTKESSENQTEEKEEKTE